MGSVAREARPERASLKGAVEAALTLLRGEGVVGREGRGKLQRSFEQNAAKVSKKIVLRRSEILIAPASNQRLAP
jgi:hypothetical protein